MMALGPRQFIGWFTWKLKIGKLPTSAAHYPAKYIGRKEGEV